MTKDQFKIEENGLGIETNWNGDVTPCKKIKFTINDKSVIVDRDFIYQLLVFFGKDKDLDKLVKSTNEEIVSTRRQLSIKAKTDIKKGELIVISVDFPVPKSIFERIEKFKLKN